MFDNLKNYVKDVAKKATTTTVNKAVSYTHLTLPTKREV